MDCCPGFLSGDRGLEGAVVEVIDHCQLSCPAVTMEMTMSCTALVLERILSSSPEILDQQLALLLYGESVCPWCPGVSVSPVCPRSMCLLCVFTPGVMVVDCVNLPPAAGKVTVKDLRMIHWLQMQFPDLPQRDALHTALITAKFNVSGKTHRGPVSGVLMRKWVSAISL